MNMVDMSSMEAQHGAGISAQGVIIFERQRRCGGNHLTNRWSQPLAAVKSTFDFMKQSWMFATFASASGGSALSR
jgi:hypothetical protein